MNFIQLDPRAIAYVEKKARDWNMTVNEVIEKAIGRLISTEEFSGWQDGEDVLGLLDFYGYWEDRWEIRDGKLISKEGR